MEYTFYLGKDGKKPYHWFLILMMLLNALASWYVFFVGNIKWGYAVPATVLLILAAVFAKKSRHEYFYGTAAFFWVLTPYYYIAAILILLLLLVWKTNAPVHVMVNREGVTVKNVFTKKYEWEQIQYAVLKDDVLTISFSSNKFIQENIQAGKTVADEKTFNEFCNNQINRPSLN